MTKATVLVFGVLLATPGCGYFGRSGSQGSGATEAATEAPPPEYGLPELPADPIRLEANLGQFGDGVRFGARAPGYRLSLTESEAILTLVSGSSGDVVRISFLGGSHTFDPDAWTPLPGVSHYLTDPDPSAWITNVPGHGHVRFPEVRPSTDVVFHGAASRQVEVDFVLRPGASVEDLGLRFDGAAPSGIDAEGRAHLQLPQGELVLEAPRAYQTGSQGQEPVFAAYAIEGFDVRIDVGTYDPDRVLVVDPVLVYQVSSGTTLADAANAVAVDESGNAYVAGRDRQLFPGSYDNAFVTKRDSTGTLVWQTVFGHQFGRDEANAIALPPDGSFEPIVAGATTSCFFPGDPCSTDPQTPPELAAANAFLIRLTSDGSGVVFGRSFGGAGDDRARALAIGPTGTIHVVGRTSSTDFPSAGRVGHDLNPYPDPSHNGGDDAFVTRWSAAGALSQAGYLGGAGDDDAVAVVLDASGRPHLATTTFSSNFPVSFGGYAGRGDVAVTRFAADGRSYDLSFYAQGPLDGSGQPASSIADKETAAGVAVDEQGRIFVAGTRRTLVEVFELQFFLPPDSFLRTYSTAPGAAQLVNETIVGTGLGEEEAVAVVAQRTNRSDTARVYFLSSVNAAGFPEVSPAGGYSGGHDFYLQVSSVGFLSSPSVGGPTLRIATYLGTSGDEHGGGLAVDRTFSAFAAGRTVAGTSEDAIVSRVQLRAAGDLYTALEDATLFATNIYRTVLANDTELFLHGTVFGLLGNGTEIETVLESGPSHAALFTFSEHGTFTYRGLPDYIGPDSFVYRVMDGDSLSAPATVTLEVQNADDDPPVGVADAYVTDEDVPLEVAAPGVLANDLEHDGQAITAELVRGPEVGGVPFGALSLSPDGGFVYTPPLHAFTLPDAPVTFEYVARDASGMPALATTFVSITVTSVNDTPVAVADYFSTPVGVALAVSASQLLANDSDVENDGLSVVSVQAPVDGTVSLSGSTITFVPSSGFFGPGSFVYKVSDDGSPPRTDTATVTVLVSRPPVAQADVFALPDPGVLVAAPPGVLANDSDPDGESFSAQLLTAPEHGTLSLHPLGGFSYVADRAFDGSDTFTYRAIDAGGIPSGPATVTITGTARSGDESITIDEDPEQPAVVEVLTNDPGVDINAPPETEVVYCYDGYDAACGGSDAPATAFAAGRLTRAKDKPGDVAFAYDAAGRQVREARTLALPGETRTLVTETAFDESGNPVSTTLPTGMAIEREFDETDREVSVAVRAPGGPATPLIEVGGGVQGDGWYPYGGLRAWRAASGTLAFTIEQDASGWTTRTSVTSVAPGESAEATYRYANDGSVIAIDSPTENNVGHDSLGRITFDRGSSYTYDDAGNRLSGPGGALTYSDPGSNRWCTADDPDAANSCETEDGSLQYEFDPAGNVTRRGELALVTADDGTVIALDSPTQGKSRFYRDHRNLRLATAGASANERFVHSWVGDLELRLGEPIAEPCGTGQIREVTPVEHYVYLGGRRVAMVPGRLEGACGSADGTAVASIGASHLYFADKMDLARAVYRESDGRAVWRGEFDGFAVPVGAGIDEDPDGDDVAFVQAFRLPGQQEIRGTELSENWNRVYDRVAGRYLQPDPAGDDPVSYDYAAGSPLSNSDPTGLTVKTWTDGITAYVWVHRVGCADEVFKFAPPGWTQAQTPSWWPYRIRLRSHAGGTAQVRSLGSGPGPFGYFPPGNVDATPTDCCAQDRAAIKAGQALVRGGAQYRRYYWQSGLRPADFAASITNAATGAACSTPEHCPNTPPVGEAP